MCLLGFPLVYEKKKKLKVCYSIIACSETQAGAEDSKRINPENYVHLMILYLASEGQTCEYISEVSLQTTDSFVYLFPKPNPSNKNIEGKRSLKNISYTPNLSLLLVL